MYSIIWKADTIFIFFCFDLGSTGFGKDIKSKGGNPIGPSRVIISLFKSCRWRGTLFFILKLSWDFDLVFPVSSPLLTDLTFCWTLGYPQTLPRNTWIVKMGLESIFPIFFCKHFNVGLSVVYRYQNIWRKQILLKPEHSQMPRTRQGPDLQNIFLRGAHYPLGPGPSFGSILVMVGNLLGLWGADVSLSIQ